MDLDIRYIAGLFDGEGWITIGKSALGGYRKYSKDYVRYQLHIGIAMSFRPLIEQIHRQFYGGLFINRGHKKRLPNARDGYVWYLSSNPAAEFLDFIKPHLVVKKEEAEIAIIFQEHVRRYCGHLTHKPELRASLYAEREEFRNKLLALKKRCFDTPIDSDPIPTAA